MAPGTAACVWGGRPLPARVSVPARSRRAAQVGGSAALDEHLVLKLPSRPPDEQQGASSHSNDATDKTIRQHTSRVISWVSDSYLRVHSTEERTPDRNGPALKVNLPRAHSYLDSCCFQTRHKTQIFARIILLAPVRFDLSRPQSRQKVKTEMCIHFIFFRSPLPGVSGDFDSHNNFEGCTHSVTLQN